MFALELSALLKAIGFPLSPTKASLADNKSDNLPS